MNLSGLKGMRTIERGKRPPVNSPRSALRPADHCGLVHHADTLLVRRRLRQRPHFLLIRKNQRLGIHAKPEPRVPGPILEYMPLVAIEPRAMRLDPVHAVYLDGLC